MFLAFKAFIFTCLRLTFLVFGFGLFSRSFSTPIFTLKIVICLFRGSSYESFAVDFQFTHSDGMFNVPRLLDINLFIVLMSDSRCD